MTNRFVISDPHFNHAGILFIPGREKFRHMTIEEHDQRLIENWNMVVGKRDVVYLLGDIGYDRPKGYVTAGIRPQLNGRIEVVGGNHDTAEILQCFDKVHGVMVKQICGYKCVITHIPIHPQEMYWDYNIHGHLHSNVVKKWAETPDQGRAQGEYDPRYISACCEHVNFTPIPIEDLVMIRARGRKENRPPEAKLDEDV